MLGRLCVLFGLFVVQGKERWGATASVECPPTAAATNSTQLPHTLDSRLVYMQYYYY
jgi:hypothetical protein